MIFLKNFRVSLLLVISILFGSLALSVPALADNLSTAFSVTTPGTGSTASGTVIINGSTGSQWVNVRAYNLGANMAPVSIDNTPVNGKYALSMDTSQLPNGVAQIAVIAFSVPPGDPAGIPYTQQEINLTLNVQNGGGAISTSGTCGTANGLSLIKAPSRNLCSVGTSSTISGNGPWNWSCSGTNGGSSASCSASVKQQSTTNFSVTTPAKGATVSGAIAIKGASGSQWVNVRAYNLGANMAPVSIDNTPINGTYALSVDTTQLPNGTAQIAVIAFSVPPGDPAGIPYTQQQINLTLNVQNIIAIPTAGMCGSSNGQSLSSTPVTGLCSIGTSSTVSGNGPWNWNCSGTNGGSNTSCSATLKPQATNGTCGPSNGQTLSGAPATGLCSVGTSSTIGGSGPWNWSCSGTNGGSSASCSAALQPVATNGTCGSSNGQTLSNAPSAGLCSVGISSTINGSGPWNWSCSGTNGGSNASCSAQLQAPAINGTCGASNGQTLSNAPSSGLCTVGKSSTVSGNGPWSWSCSGANGGSNSSCGAALQPQAINGSCGSSNGQTLSSAPATALCSVGTSSTINGSGPWNWSCFGANGGSTAICSAALQPQPVNGTCGPSNGKALNSVPATGLCSVGTSSSISGNGPWNWSCSGTDGGSTSTCSATKTPSITNLSVTTPSTGATVSGAIAIRGAVGSQWVNVRAYNMGTSMAPVSIDNTPVNGTYTLSVDTTQLPNGTAQIAVIAFSVPPGDPAGIAYTQQQLNLTLNVQNTGTISTTGLCGSSNGQTLSSAPTTGLCSIGTSSTISGDGPWNWSCAGINGGGAASCSAALQPQATNGTCGPSNGQSLSGAPSTGLCSIGTSSTISGSGPWNWSCSGTNGGSNSSCSAQLQATAINGTCGASSGQTLSLIPSTGLCNAGSASSVSGSGPWNWSCTGANGGSNASCSAQLQVPVINGTCGASNGQTLSSAPATGLCSVGTSSTISGSGPWNWSCSGANGGSNASCSAQLQAPAINGTCGSSNGQTLNSAPSTGLCSVGTSSSVSGNGPWNWSCSGSNGGSNASCSAKSPATSQSGNALAVTTPSAGTTVTGTIQISGAAGSQWVNVRAYSSSGTPVSDNTTPSNGTFTLTVDTTEIPNGSETINVIAFSVPAGNPQGIAYTQTQASTTLDIENTNSNSANGVCGSSNGQMFTLPPANGLCASGTISTLTTLPDRWIWTCSATTTVGTSSNCEASIIGSLPIRAADFLSSLGVNTHLSQGSAYYSFPQTVIADMQYIGMINMRDSYSTYWASNYVTVAQAGMKYDFIAGVGGLTSTTSDLQEFFGYMDQLNATVPGSVAALEGPNEINNWPVTFNNVGGLQGAINMQQAIYSYTHSDKSLTGVPVYYFTGYDAVTGGPGPNPWTTSGLADFDNQHPYPVEPQPPYSAASLNNVHNTVPGSYGPTVYTETGYNTVQSTVAQQASYIADFYMDAAAMGVSRTYIYELMDEGDGWGIFDTNNNPKPAATALHNLTTILRDTGAAAGSFTPATALYTLANMPNPLFNLQLQKSNGMSDIVLWNEPTTIPGSPTTVTVTLNSPAATISVYDIFQGTAPIQTLSNTGTVNVTVTDHPVIIEAEWW